MEGWVLFAFIVAHIVAWLVMGVSWSAAFRAPFAVLIPGIALASALAVMFDGFDQLFGMIMAMIWFSGLFLFGVMCLRVAIPKGSDEAAPQGDAPQT